MNVDVNAVNNIAYIDNNGNAVQVTLAMAVIHELGHALTGREDNYDITKPDYSGANDIFVNKIYAELGIPLRNSYISAGSTTLLTPGYAYTNGAAIDDSVLVSSMYKYSPGGNFNSGNTANTKDLLIGDSGNNILDSGGGDDFLFGGGGNDTLRGGAGTDTAIYLDNNPADYDIREQTDGSWVVRDVRGAATEGTDTLQNIEILQFDRTQHFNLTKGGLSFQTDLVFVVDTTGSMGPYLAGVKAQATAIITALFNGGKTDARIAIESFKDTTNGEPSTTILKFTNQDSFADRQTAAINAINRLSASGGGDIPETDNDGLIHALSGDVGLFRSGAANKQIVLFTDAPVKDTALDGQVAALAANPASDGPASAPFATPASSAGSGDTGSVPATGGFSDDPSDPDSNSSTPPPFVDTVDPITASTGTTRAVLYAIQDGTDSTATASLKTLATTTGGSYLDAPAASDLTSTLLKIVANPPTPVSLPPTITSVAPGTVEKGQTAVIGTVKAGTAGDTLTVAGTSGAGTISLGPVQTDGTQLIIYTAPAAISASTTDAVSYTVTEGSQTPTGSASVQWDAGPSIAAQTPAIVENRQTTVIGVVTPGLAGDTLTLAETAGSGTLGLGAARGDGTRQIIYTAPATIATGVVDKVSYAVHDQHNGAVASALANVQLDAGPSVSGAVAGQTVAATGSLSPFSGVAITEMNAAVTVTVTITESVPGNGSLSNLGGGTYTASTGAYTISGPARSVQSAIEGLIFIPNPALTSPGSRTTMGFAISVGDGVSPTVTDTTSSVIATAPPMLPDVSGALNANVESAVLAVQSALQPAGTTLNSIYEANPAGSAPSAQAGALNALVVTAATAGSTGTVPAGFQAAYLIGAAGSGLADANGNALLVAAAANATLFGAANDTLAGGQGSETLTAGAGAETLLGGTGANLFSLGGGTALVNSQGTDTVIGGSGGATVNATNNLLYFGGSGATDINATTGAPTIVGGGAETVAAGSGNALVFGGTGVLTFLAGSGASTIISGAGGANLTGGNQGLLYFGTGPTTYTAGTAVDTVVGYTGSLTATGGANGTMFFTGTGGNNQVTTGTGASTIIGFGANDLLTAAGSGNNVIEAAGAAETVTGANSTGINTFFAFGANDMVIGGAGQTAIESALGNHTLVAGSGATLFEILAGTANRAITIGNFVAGNDFVQLQGYAAGAGANALQTATATGGNEVVTLPDGTKITFQGVTHLTSAAFV